MRRRIHRILVVAGLLAMIVGLWPSSAQALVCKVQNFHWCSDYVCCVQTCVYCLDPVTGQPIGVECSDADCWDQFP
jgi:hypothetical protein